MPRFIAALIVFSLSIPLISCGGASSGAASLVVSPATAYAYTDLSVGAYSPAMLTAKLSNGTTPVAVSWKTTDGCVAVDTTSTANPMAVVCNLSCGGSRTATITATSGTLSGTSTVTCTWK